MTHPIAAAARASLPLLLLLGTPELEGVVVEGYPGSLRVRTPAGDVVAVALSADGTRAYRWDGTPLPWEAARAGERVRVEVVGEYYSAYAAGTAAVVVVGPPADPPDFAFAAIVEAYAAGQDEEVRWLVRNLGSRSWAVRERSTREIKGMGRARAAGALLWGREMAGGDAEVGARIEGIMRAMWLQIEVEGAR